MNSPADLRKPLQDKPLATTPQERLDQGLDQAAKLGLALTDPTFATLADAWPDVPALIKNAILGMIASTRTAEK